jgi:hypothetical protein
MKIEGTQDIPSEILDSYTKLLNQVRPNGTVQKRTPFRYPDFQAGGKKVTAGQVAQRARFLTARNLFSNTSEAERQRWYAARPEWNSLLWYYNYFMMSALNGNANAKQGGAGVVKSIQVVSDSVAVSGDTTINIDTIDPTKAVVFLFGNSFINDKVYRGDNTVNAGSTDTQSIGATINTDVAEVKISGASGNMNIAEGVGDGYWGDVVLDALTSTQITVKATDYISPYAIPYSWEVIEHLSQTVYPIIKEINADNIKVGWPIEPDVATIISAIVIEYI